MLSTNELPDLVQAGSAVRASNPRRQRRQRRRPAQVVGHAAGSAGWCSLPGGIRTRARAWNFVSKLVML